MVEVKIEWNKRNLSRYLKYTAFFKSKGTKLAGIFFLICYVLIMAVCLVAFFVMDYLFMLITGLVVTLFVVLYALLFALTIKSYTKNALKENTKSDLNKVIIGNEDILALKDDEPIGKLSWDKIANIYFNEKAGSAYLVTKDNAVLILEYHSILNGSAEELKEILNAKKAENDKLSEKA